jgi:hypothetical protein
MQTRADVPLDCPRKFVPVSKLFPALPVTVKVPRQFREIAVELKVTTLNPEPIVKDPDGCTRPCAVIVLVPHEIVPDDDNEVTLMAPAVNAP